MLIQRILVHFFDEESNELAESKPYRLTASDSGFDEESGTGKIYIRVVDPDTEHCCSVEMDDETAVELCDYVLSRIKRRKNSVKL